MIKKIITIIMVLLFVGSVIPSRTFAAGDPLEIAIKDSVYGGILGALIGGALMVFSDKISDHYMYIAYGAAGGVIAGAAIGMATSTKALAEIEHNKVTFNMPELKNDIIKDKHEEKLEVIRTVSLLRYNF